MFYNEHELPSSMRDWNAEILWFACFWTPQQGSFSTHTHCKHTHCKHTQRFNLRVCLLSTFHISSLKDPHGRRADEGVTVLLPNRHTHRKLAVSTETHTHCSKALLKTFISFLKSTKTAEAVSSWCILYFSVFLNGNTSDNALWPRETKSVFTNNWFSTTKQRRILCIIATLVFKNKYTQGRLRRGDVEWQHSGVIRLAVTGHAAGTGVHTAAGVASLMGFNPTQRRHHNGSVNPLRWESSHVSASINTHRCRCDGAQGQALQNTQAQAAIISDLSHIS